MSDQRNDVRIETSEKNTITEATLFSEQAYVTRQAETEVESGIQRLLVDIDAFRLDPDSVQAKVYGKGEMLGVQYKRVPVIEAPQEDLRVQEEQLRQLKRERRRISDARQVVEKQQKFIDSTIDYAGVEIPREIKTSFPTAGQLGEMIDFMDSKYSDLNSRHDELTIKLEDIDNEILALERSLKKSKRTTTHSQNVIEVLFDSTEQQELRLEVSYSVYQAGWTPFYKVDVAEDLSGLQLTQFARIRQTSGEEWNGIQLTVSTAEPLRGAYLPEPTQWLLRPPAPVYLEGAIMPDAIPMAAAVAEDFAAGSAEEELEILEDAAPAPAAIAEAERKVLPSAFEYQLPQPVDIPSGDDDTLLTLTSRNADGNFHHHAVPRFDNRCYLVCETEGDPELPPGQLNIHFAGRFVASTHLNEQNAGEPLRFNLGVDRSVRVKRETITDKTAETFFRLVDRSQAARELEYKLTVENLRDDTVKIDLFDSVPVSNTDRYLVKGLELDPEPTESDWEEREGVMCWKLDVPSKAQKEINIRFFLKYPRNERPEGI